MIDDKTAAAGSIDGGESFRDVMMNSDEDADAACLRALEAVGKATGGSPAAVQRLLDSAAGAGLARMVCAICDEEDLSLETALDEAVRRQQGWVFGHAAAREHGISHDAPYLTGWVSVFARTPLTAPPVERWWLRAPFWRPPEMFGPVTWPDGLREAVGNVSAFAFRRGLEGVADMTELDDLTLSAVAAVSQTCDVTIAGAAAMVADERDGLAFSLSVRANLAFEPDLGLDAALYAAFAAWMALPLGKHGAERTGFSDGLPRLQGLAMAHDRRLWLERHDGG
jgi:hypothetical protein